MGGKGPDHLDRGGGERRDRSRIRIHRERFAGPEIAGKVQLAVEYFPSRKLYLDTDKLKIGPEYLRNRP
jgi:hypothetical protein